MLPPSAGFGYRVVIDLFPTQQAKFDANAGWPADLKTARKRCRETGGADRRPAAPRVSGGKKIVVIDPGHGGIDSGTNGVNGLMEKDLVLAEGLEAGAGAESARLYRAHDPRQRRLHSLAGAGGDRRAADKADLLISLHADSNPDPSVSGLSIYTLNDGRSDREAAALARRENQSDVIAGVDLSGDNNPVAPILIDLAQRDTINKSSRLRRKPRSSQLASVTDILARSPTAPPAWRCWWRPMCPRC